MRVCWGEIITICYMEIKCSFISPRQTSDILLNGGEAESNDRSRVCRGEIITIYYIDITCIFVSARQTL